ncbi:hypothetical protein [Micrococcus porci]|uniref:hypothetical protein n=1 Tax=Micrococcus porci TaxID=2856555 RepID=UPI003CF8808B
MSSTLFLNGIVHSASDPYATAALVSDGVVAWLGDDSSADRVADPDVPRVDLAGAVLAPAFVEPGGPSVDPAQALRHGVAIVTVLAESGQTAQALQAAADPALQTVVYRAADTVDAEAAGVWLPAEGEALAALVVASTRAREQVHLVPAAGGDPAEGQVAALAALRSAAEELGAPALGRGRHRVVLTAPITAEDRALLAAISASVTVAPEADGVLRAPLGTLLAEGVPVCLSTAGEAGPWAAVRAALSHPDEAERISARSAFTAATRTPLRVLPDAPGATVQAAPRLTVSAPATFAVWEADAVAVQSPDGRVAAWSTDTRAGTPLLPALDAETALPRWRATWVDGRPAAVEVADA